VGGFFHVFTPPKKVTELRDAVKARAAEQSALTPPPASPSVTLGADAGAAASAASAKQRKRSEAGSTLATSVPRSSVQAPTASGAPRTLIGY
jgi:hypothetical protein